VRLRARHQRSIAKGCVIVAIGAVGASVLAAQSNGRDLPLGVRSIAGVTLNEDSAVSIRAKLGPTPERRIGSGHDAYLSWCYVSPNALLELMSDDSDMRTPGRALNVIRLRADAPSSEREGCASLGGRGLSTSSGLRLGLDSVQIERLLGTPTRRVADSLIYFFDAKQYLRHGTPEYNRWDTPEYWETCFNAGPPFANVSAMLLVVMREGRAIEIRIGRNDQSVC
jgi:hypothetical protein